MGDLTEARIDMVRRLLQQAPDAAVENLDALFTNDLGLDSAVQAIRRIVDGEALERRARAAVFAPFAPLFIRTADLPRLSFSPSVLADLWRGLKRRSPHLLAAATENGLPEGRAAGVHDEVCRDAADALRERTDPAFIELAQKLDQQDGGARKLERLLSLSPVLRRAAHRLPAWLVNLHGEEDAAIRVAFKQAAECGEEAGVLFMEALLAHLDEPAHILRLISVVMDRPTDRYLAASELASFGARLLDAIDADIERMRRLDPTRGLEGGVAAASAVVRATLRLSEFEQGVALSRDGIWGARVIAQRKSLAQTVEIRLSELEVAISAALPAQAVRLGAKRVRGGALVDRAPEPGAVARALSLAALLDGCRPAAVHGGFGALRARVAEAADVVLDGYSEELVALLHREGAQGARARCIRAYLDVAAELIALVRDPQSAELVRRRAAAA